MFESFVNLAKSISERVESEEIRNLAKEIEEISKEAKEMVENLDKKAEELLKVEPKLREKAKKLIESALSERAFELAKFLAVLNGDVVKEIAREVYSERFDDYDGLINELISKGIVEESEFTMRMNDVAKDVLEEFEGEEHHRYAVRYYERVADSLENRAYLAYHCLKAGDLDRALDVFVKTANEIYGRHPSVEILIEVGEKLAGRIENSDEKCRVLGTLGNLYLAIKKYDEAEAFYKAVLKYYAEKSKENPEYRKFVAGVLNNLGNLHFSKGETDKAEKAYTDCLKTLMEMGDEERMVPVLIALGDLFMTKEDFENAEKCFHDALRIELKKAKEDRSRLENVAMLVNNLGYIYSRKKDLEKAERFYREAIRLFGEISKDRPEAVGNLATALSNLSSLYMNAGKVEKAMEILEEIKGLWDRIPPDVRATFYMNLAKGLEKKGDSKAAEFYLKAGALGFLVFRNYGINAVNFMHCFDKAIQLGGEDLKGDAELIKAVILKKYYGVKSELPEIERCGRRGEVLIKASKGERVEIEISDEVDMAVYILASELP